MPIIFSTFSVLNLERSSEERFLQFSNMLDILSTFSVLKLERSREVRVEQL